MHQLADIPPRGRCHNSSSRQVWRIRARNIWLAIRGEQPTQQEPRVRIKDLICADTERSGRRSIMDSNALSKSRSVLTLTTNNCSPSLSPASCASRASGSASGLLGLMSMAINEAFGTSWCSTSRRFATSGVPKKVTPVAFPPGRFRLGTNPCLTGSPCAVNTIGIVWVVAIATCGEGRARRAIGRRSSGVLPA